MELQKPQAVIARYEEDVSWAQKLGIPAVIYNKGQTPTGLEGGFQVIPRKNVGRETETYLNYIVERYDTLPEFVVFLQGDPFAHSRNALEIIAGNTTPRRVIPLSTNWKREVVGRYDWPGFEDCIRDLARYMGVSSDVLGYATGAQYIVPRTAILTRSKGFYEALLDRLSKATHPHEAWAMERLWPYVFGAKNRTDRPTLDVMVPEPMPHLEEVLREVEARRGDFLFTVSAPEKGQTLLSLALEKGQDLVLFAESGHRYAGEIFDELIDTYYIFKMNLFREDDLCLAVQDDPALYEVQNLHPVRVARGGKRHWRENFLSSHSFLTHYSVLAQHADLFSGSNTPPDAGRLFKERGVPFLSPMPSLV